MKKSNAQNIRWLREYQQYLEGAKRLDTSTVDSILKSINRFEEYTGFIDFSKFRSKHAKGFKKYLLTQKSQVTGEPLSKSTVNTILYHLRQFFQYLSTQKGYRAKINYADIDYFSLSEKDTRVANAKRKKLVASDDQILKTLDAMPFSTDIEMRDRAAIAFIYLTGARDAAVASAKLKHIDLDEKCFFQDAREVNTKFSKTFPTYFFPVGEQVFKIIADWVHHLEALGFKGNDPLFPKTKLTHDEKQQFVADGLLKEHWSDASPIRKIFKNAFEAVELPYFKPHSIRNTLVRLGERLCHTPEEFKAWSQNLGHESVLTTFYSYGTVPDYKQAELLRKLAQPAVNVSNDMQQQFEQFIQFQQMQQMMKQNNS